MKKIILALSAIALVVSCSQSRKWTDKERDEVRKVVRDRHDRSAIRHMEAKNYTNLEECVVTTIEETYPDYNRFDKLTGKIKELYRTPDLFTIALFDEPGVPTEVADAMQQCASMVVSPADQAKADAKAKTDANSAPAQNGK